MIDEQKGGLSESKNYGVALHSDRGNGFRQFDVLLGKYQNVT